VLRLIDAGKVKGSDKVSIILDPYLRRYGQGSLASIYGPHIENATVLDLIRMGAGIPDFEDSPLFDQWVLAPENSSHFQDYPYAALKWSVSEENRKGAVGSPGPLYCNPGTCTAYSSTSFEVAGLVIAAILHPNLPWYEVDLGAALFPDRTAYPSMSFPPKGNNSSAKLSTYLTVPGKSYGSAWGSTTIFDQHPTVLGWTCGNLVATPSDVAAYFYDLLDKDAMAEGPAPLLSQASITEMTTFRNLTKGWRSGKDDAIRYGAGLMNSTVGYSQKLDVHGHEGDTYGFMSAQGYLPLLKGAFSVAVNIENEDGEPMYRMECMLLQTVHHLIHGASPNSLGCDKSMASSKMQSLLSYSTVMV